MCIATRPRCETAHRVVNDDKFHDDTFKAQTDWVLSNTETHCVSKKSILYDSSKKYIKIYIASPLSLT